MQCPECNGHGEIADLAVSTEVKTQRGKLERGWRRQWLLGKLARSEGSHRALATALGVVPSAVTAFARRHLDEIVEIRQRMDQQITDLWISDKLARLAEMQQDVNDINEVIEKKIDDSQPAPFDPLDPANDGASTPSATDDLPAWFRVKAGILRAAAEELGQIPQRVQVQVGGTIVTYRIDGVDLDRV